MSWVEEGGGRSYAEPIRSYMHKVVGGGGGGL